MRRRTRLITLCVTLLLLARATVLSTSAQVQVYRSVKTDTRRIAITFDDGPHPYLTESILKTLDKYDVKATFFMVGVNVVNYPDAARAVISAGHEVGNHTFSHEHMTRLSEAQVQRELGLCEDALEELCEYRPHLFRPPEGALTPFVRHCSERSDYARFHHRRSQRRGILYFTRRGQIRRLSRSGKERRGGYHVRFGKCAENQPYCPRYRFHFPI